MQNISMSTIVLACMEHEINKPDFKKILLALLGAGILLTKRESEIFLLLASGKKNREIADMLYIDYLTVRSHRANIYKKCSVNSKFDLGKIAEKLGLL
jgi:DNA-binding NarL/FixJ family response regulator